MTKKSNIEPSNSEASNGDQLKPGDLNHDSSDGTSEDAVENNQSSSKPRKAGLSKREIMEELSRARFPWDE